MPLDIFRQVNVVLYDIKGKAFLKFKFVDHFLDV